MNKLFEALDEVEHKLEKMDTETDREARKRQPWMPIGGAVIAALCLFMLAYFLFGA